jgi:hypothetical protein
VPGHLPYKTLNAGYLLATMEEAENRLNLIFLDACRDNPFTKGWFRGRGLEKGLAPMQASVGWVGAKRNPPFIKPFIKKGGFNVRATKLRSSTHPTFTELKRWV